MPLNVPELPGAATAVILSVTVRSSGSGGDLIVFSDGVPIPADPTIAFPAHGTVTCQVVAPINAQSIDFLNRSGSPVRATADLEGYYLP